MIIRGQFSQKAIKGGGVETYRSAHLCGTSRNQPRKGNGCISLVSLTASRQLKGQINHTKSRESRKSLQLANAAAKMLATELDSGLGFGLLNTGFSDGGLERFAIGVLGDLHLEPAQMHLFGQAAAQMRDALTRSASHDGSRIVQLGDLGGYKHKPGSRHCFKVAAVFLRSFCFPAALVTGNHDLEGEEFNTDEENLDAWKQSFEQRHYWAAQLGPALCIGLSTVRFRSNKDSVHEVFVDDKQLKWFEQQLEASAGRPVVVFTHAPPLGCGLKVVEDVHVKNRCAWLNHSSNPDVFLDFVQRFSNIKLWFSGHYHLSQNYPDSISSFRSCAFIQTGVIGECDRDGYHQSRILQGDREGFRVLTLNHANGAERLDLHGKWAAPTAPKTEWLSSTPEQWWPESLAFNQSGPAVSGSGAAAWQGREGEQWFGAGPDRVLRRMGRLVVEYNAAYRAAVGVVFTDADSSLSARLVDGSGQRVDCEATALSRAKEDGSRAVAVQLMDVHSNVVRRVERNEEGGFFQVFQKNKWRQKQLQEEQRRIEPAAVAL